MVFTGPLPSEGRGRGRGGTPRTLFVNEINNALNTPRLPNEAAEGARAYLQSIVDTLREPLLVLDADLRVVSASRAFYQTYRVVPNETEGRLVYELGDGQWDIPALRTLLEDVSPSQRAFDDVEVVHDFPGIGRRIMLLNARKTYQPGNQSKQILLALEDVTERRATEARLHETDERLRLLVEGTRDHAMILLDPIGRIVHWNTGAERILGWTEAEVLGKHGALIFTPEDRATNRPEQEMTSARETGRTEDKRWHLKKDGARFFADGVMTGLRGENGTSDGPLRGYAKVMRDATDLKREQDALQAAFERERRITEALQRPLLLEIAEKAFPGLAVATRYEAALAEASVGGDFFDAFALPGGQIALVIADVSGKGLSAAARAIQVRDVVRAFARETPADPARALSRLNDFVCDTRHLDEPQGAEGFVCLALATLDPASGAGRVASAGCEPPLIVRAAAAGGATNVLEIHGLPLGIEPGEGYHALPFSLALGDTLLLCTDGLTEARRGREFLGYEGMTEIAARALKAQSTTCEEPLRDAARAIVEAARDFARGVLTDDTCLLLARRCRDAGKD